METRCRRGKTSRGKILRGRLFDAPPSRRRTMESTDKGKTQETLRSGAGRNKPATLKRRKPSRWCKTTGVEQDLKRGCFGSEHPSTDGWGEDALRHLDERGYTIHLARPAREIGTKPKRGRFESSARGDGRTRDESERKCAQHPEVGHTARCEWRKDQTPKVGSEMGKTRGGSEEGRTTRSPEPRG